jgi:hypothetical protein
MRPRHLFVPALISLLALAGCTPDLEDADPAARLIPRGAVLVRTPEGIRHIDLRTGYPRFELPASSVISPGGDVVFKTSFDRGVTELTKYSVRSRRELSKTQIDGEWRARVASSNATKLALMHPELGTDPYVPEGRARTEILVADTESLRTRSYKLKGNFEPEAFSTHDRSLYLIEYLPALSPNRYTVRVLNLATGRDRAIGRSKLSAPGQMRGTGRTQLFAPDKSVLYTLYTRQGPNRAHGAVAPTGAGHGHVYAFIHRLDLTYGTAHCIDLPQPFGTGLTTTSALATSLFGTRLFVADSSTGAIALVDTHDAKVLLMSHHGPQSAQGDPAVAAVNPGGDTLYVAAGSKLRTFTTDTLKLVDEWTLSGAARGIKTSVDGSIIYVALKDEIVLLDTSTGNPIDTLPVPGIRSFLH